jgi:hypothetical protein
MGMIGVFVGGGFVAGGTGVSGTTPGAGGKGLSGLFGYIKVYAKNAARHNAPIKK